jgi:hypothetical protein
MGFGFMGRGCPALVMRKSDQEVTGISTYILMPIEVLIKTHFVYFVWKNE